MTKVFFQKMIVVVGLLLITSCREARNDLFNESLTSISSKQSINNTKLQQEFVKSFSKVISSDSEVFNFLKEEACKKFDNNTDILYHVIKEHRFSDGEFFRWRVFQRKDLI